MDDDEDLRAHAHTTDVLQIRWLLQPYVIPLQCSLLLLHHLGAPGSCVEAEASYPDGRGLIA